MLQAWPRKSRVNHFHSNVAANSMNPWFFIIFMDHSEGDMTKFESLRAGRQWHPPSNKMLEAFSLLWQYKSEHHGDLAITLENSQLRDEILGGHTKKFLFLTQKRGNYFHFQPFPTMSLIINFVFHPLHYYSYMYSSSYVVIINTTQSTSLLPSSLPSPSSFLPKHDMRSHYCPCLSIWYCPHV